MRVKPHGIWYIVPVVIIMVGFFVMIFQFFSAITVDGLDVTELELDEVYEMEMDEDSYFALYVENQVPVNYVFYNEDNRFYVDYTDWFSDTQTIEVTIQKVPDGTVLEGYDIDVMDISDVDRDTDFINFADIEILEAGIYQVTFLSDDDIDFEFGVKPIDLGAISESFSAIVVTILTTLGLSTLSFLLIIIKRSKSKKQLYRRSDVDNYSNQYYSEEQKRRLDSQKSNDY